MISLLLAASLAAADAGAAAPASEAAIDAFLAALPPAKEVKGDDADKALDEASLAALIGRNPGREADVRATFAAYRGCKRDSGDKAVAQAVRSSARRLGDEKLARLTAFYRSPDFGAFGRLADLPEAERSPTDRAELERIRAEYPLDDYFESTRATERQMWSEEGLLGALLKCEEALESELARRGLNR